MDEQEYLEPDFDPSTLTVPRLRSILVAHNVNYPSSAKKGQLIELFNEHVVPQARKIRSANARVKRTSRGIVDVPASQSTADDEDEEQLIAQQAASARKGRRTTRARTEEAQEVVPTPKSARHSTAPPESAPVRTSSKHGRAVDRMEPVQEPEPKRPASRKSRLSAQTPVVKSELVDDDSPFSSENVFQSGSSPPAPTDRRRTTSSAAQEADRRRSRDARRRTEEVKPVRQQMDGAVVPSRRTFEMPVSVLKKPKREEVEPSEEFTPEEQMALVQAEQAGELVPARPRTTRPASKVASTGVSAILIALLAGFATLWSQEKFQVGYCGEGHASREIAGVEIPEWADIARPMCQRCPPHAICGPDLETTCEPDFVLTHHPLSLNGILPIAPTCEPDSAKAKKVDQVKARVIRELRDHNAKYECGESKKPEIRESELKARVSSKRASRMADSEFQQLWDSAIGEVRKADEVTQGTDGSGHFTLRSNSLALVPLSCAFRRSLQETLREHFWLLVGVLTVLSSGTYGRYRITSGRQTEARAKELAGVALERLSMQASLHASDPETYRENYVSVVQLRDDVLRNDFSTWSRKKLWEKVQQKVEHNANVRPMVREGRAGDVGRVWEWTGALAPIESPPMTGNERRRKSGRVSFGGERFIEPSSFESTTEMSQVGRWEEGKKYY